VIPPVQVLHHLGDLHPFETVLVLLLAFGPFVVIVLLVVVDRRRSGAAGDETRPRDAQGG
jgi:hypothetical protein